jgi:hypothetical protein
MAFREAESNYSSILEIPFRATANKENEESRT